MPDATVPGSPADEPTPAPRAPAERAADHDAIDRLAADLLPALIGKLTATGLGEIEVREGAWKVRLRRPADGPAVRERRSGEKPGRAVGRDAAASRDGHGRDAVGRDAHVAGSMTPVGPGRESRDGRGQAADPKRAIATSPAVGVYRPHEGARPGTSVRAGDRLGVVDMLGVPQDVLAPADGVVGSSLAEPGDAVEYGQELMVIELIGAAPRDERDA